MHLRSLGLDHFRCYESLEMHMGPGLHVLVGSNASGKTSILEAVHLLAVTRSHRSASDRELIQWGADWGRVTGHFAGEDGRDLSLKVTMRQRQTTGDSDAGRKSVEVNSVPRRRLTDIIGQAAAVIFGPDDLALIKGPPALRRHFLNSGISQVDPVYLADLMRYRQALRQRNECLRSIAAGIADRSMLAAWDPQVVEAGAQVSLRRSRFVSALQPHLRKVHWELTGGREQITLRYTGDLADVMDIDSKRGIMQRHLAESLDRDVALGRTFRGPHRDELEVMVTDRSLRVYGSQGQQRTAALSLTLAQAQVMQEWRRTPPIVLLDDCLSELDDDRAARMLSLTHSFEQLIVTTASWSRALDSYTGPLQVHEVGGGAVRERERDAKDPRDPV